VIGFVSAQIDLTARDVKQARDEQDGDEDIASVEELAIGACAANGGSGGRR
jgi:hypothetical protein